MESQKQTTQNISAVNKTSSLPLSLEFFPAKTEEGVIKIRQVRHELYALNPEFCSVTYGAGGSTQDGTFSAVGEILIDGINIKDITLKQLRSLTGIVTQESILFNDTVWNNLTFGEENIAENDVLEALKTANAYDFVMELPNGLHTPIGEGGGKLSGGQKQRLCIARAVLKNPPILILDEATSALDAQSELVVQDALNNVMQNRTSIIIAHRLSTVRKADVISLMSKGKIIDSNNFDNLLESNPQFKRMVELQEF